MFLFIISMPSSSLLLLVLLLFVVCCFSFSCCCFVFAVTIVFDVGVFRMVLLRF